MPSAISRSVRTLIVAATALVALPASNALAQDCPADATSLGRLASDVAAADRASAAPRINGRALSEHEETWLDWSAENVFPNLPADLSCAQKLDVMANVFWWTLKEGDIGAGNPPSYSNCLDDGEAHAWNFVCDGMWQVGFGVQAWDHPMTEVQAAVARTYGSEDAALRAAYDASSLEFKGVSWSEFQTGTAKNEKLRRSWLERAPAVGFVLESPDVASGCVKGSAKWCYQPARAKRRWPEVVKYAPTLRASRRAIQDTRAIFAAKKLCE